MNVSLIYTEPDIWAFGMRSISAFLKEAGHHTQLVFMGSQESCYSSRSLEKVRELVRDSDIIGISSMSRSSIKAKQLLRDLRPCKGLTVWGGTHRH